MNEKMGRRLREEGLHRRLSALGTRRVLWRLRLRLPLQHRPRSRHLIRCPADQLSSSLLGNVL